MRSEEWGGRGGRLRSPASVSVPEPGGPHGAPRAVRGWSSGPGLLLIVLAAAAPGTGAEDVATVDPGRVVRWAGDAAVSACLMDGRELPPVGGDCWFPVDLLTPPGPLEIGRVRDGRVELRTLEVGPYPYPEQRLTVDPSKVHLSDEDAARAARESAAVTALWQLDGPRRFRLPLAHPLAEMPAGGRFGSRRVFNGVPRSPHSGIDLPAPTGTPVLAPADGVVRLAADHFFSGQSVFLDHGAGLVTMAFHLSRIDVREGDVVRRGERIGAVGASGRATGPHLHFGIRWHGARVDPHDLLETASPSELSRDDGAEPR